MNFKIQSVTEFFVVPINNKATTLKAKYPFLTKQTWTQYFTLNLPSYPQIIINIKFNPITKGLNYSLNTIENERLTNDNLLQEGFLIDTTLYATLQPYNIFYINNTLFLVECSSVQGYDYQSLQRLHQENYNKLYNEKV